jgi:APA family basic amino acid/polyamine antiporter
MPNGINGLIAAIFLYVYSTRGYSMTMNYGRDAKNATRDIPWAIFWSMPTIMILYTGVAIVATGVLPLEQVAGQPLTYVAMEILPGPLFTIFIIGGPIMALLTTMNSTMPAQCYPIYRSVQDGWFPKSFGNLNKRGVPWKIFTVNYILGLVPMLLGFNVSEITNNIMLLGAVQSGLYAYAYWQLPSRFPKEWAQSKYHIPDGLYKLVVIISTVSVVAILIQSFRSLTPQIAIFSLVAITCCILYGYIRGGKADITIEVSVWGSKDLKDVKTV